MYKLLLVREHEQQPRPDGEIASQKMHMLEEWERLPEEHQVRVTAVMLRRLLESDLTSIPSWVAEEVQPLLTPDTLRRANVTEEDIAALRDEDLASIVEGIVNHFVYDVFWDELEFAARKLLQDKPGIRNG